MTKKFVPCRYFCLVLLVFLAACSPAETPTPTETLAPSVVPSTLTPTVEIPAIITPSPLPTQPLIPLITPDAVQVERWKEYEVALAKALFSFLTPESFLCEWDILGSFDQEVYVWVVCDILKGGRGASAPAIIYLNSNGFIQNVKILGKNSDYSSDILKLPINVQQKLSFYRFGREKVLWEHLEWRRTHPEEPPLIVFSATPVSDTVYTVTVNTGMGDGTIRLNVVSGGSIMDAVHNPFVTDFLTSQNYTIAKTLTVQSVGTYDGWVLESTETSGVGGTRNSTATTFNLGDDASDKQYVGILHFDTSGLPDTAVITSATLKIRKYLPIGTDPFTILGDLLVDMRKPYFGAVELAIQDFQANAGRIAVATFGAPVNNWYSALLNSSGRSYINLTGTTQFRLRFTTDDNNNGSADYLRFYSGDHGTVSVWPTLVIEYYVL
jgi:hypothetical protein